MENKNALNDLELRQVNGGILPKEDTQMDIKNVLTDKETEQVNGGSYSLDLAGDPVVPGNWYKPVRNSYHIGPDNTITYEYFYCTADAGEGLFDFQKYLVHDDGLTKRMIGPHDIRLRGLGFILWHEPHV